MRFNAAIAPALYASALLAGTALAQEEAETSTSAVERPTFTVRPLCLPLLVRINADLLIAYKPQGTLPGTVHRRLGLEMDPFTCQEAGLQER
jgi:hypothetical protein